MMKKNNNKRLLKCLFLIFCYVLGCLVSPISASTNAGNPADPKNHGSFDRLSLTISANNQGASTVKDFIDVAADDWYYSYLEDLVSDGIINGKSKTEFVPNGTFTFAECSAVITRYLGLENYASQRAAHLKSKSVQGCNLWYCGYFQVLEEIGVFDESMQLYSISDGCVIINAEKATSPMKRYEFATAISKSFELNGNIPSKNLYSEVSGLGHDFIMGGRYVERYLSDYENYIADYDNIPRDSREYVLKAYYNGVINGDTNGNFNPMNNIKRCEMAKVIATVRNFSLRKCLITKYCPMPANEKFFTDCNGETTLNYKYSLETLQRCASGFDASGDNVVYTAVDTLPYGYCVDIYLYNTDTSICKPVMEYTLAKGDVNSDGFTYTRKNEENLRAILVLRDQTDNAKPEFTLNVTITPEGILTKTSITSI